MKLLRRTAPQSNGYNDFVLQIALSKSTSNSLIKAIKFWMESSSIVIGSMLFCRLLEYSRILKSCHTKDKQT